jgi:hypothetical protein
MQAAEGCKGHYYLMIQKVAASINLGKDSIIILQLG